MIPRVPFFRIAVLCLVAGVTLTAGAVEAATVYVGPQESYRTLAQAFAAMKSGDTVIIRDGVYTGLENQIRSSNRPPSGTAGAYTIVRAEHAGRVVFDGALALTMLDFQGTTTMAYVEFNGLQFVRPNASVRHTITGKSWADHSAHHIKLTECGFQHALYLYYVSRVLVEDCYVTGYGRYNFMAFGSDRVIFRRAVARLDAADGGGMPISHFINYDSTDVEFQNCIAIDSDDRHYTNYEGTYGGFFVRGPFDGPDGAQYYSANTHIAGSLALNVHHSARGVGGLTLSNLASGTVIEHSVFWDQVRAYQVAKSGPTGEEFTVRHSTFGRIVANDSSSAHHAVAGFVGASGFYGDVSDSVFTRVTNQGGGVATAIREARSSRNNVFFGNTADLASVTSVTDSLTGIDPLAESLRYLVRAEAGTALAGLASDGSDVGATITKRVGTDGTLHGEPGYATLTDNDLWPWPQEATIQAFFRAYGVPGPDPRRGFCAEGQTLTNYVWGYLGHTVPPFGLTATPGPDSVTLSWQPPAPQARATLLGFRIYRVDGAHRAFLRTVDSASAVSATVAGLTPGQAVTFVMTAVDRQADESGVSEPAGATPGTAGPAPTTPEDNEPPPVVDPPGSPGSEGNIVCVTRVVAAQPPSRPGVQYVEALWQDMGVTVHAGETLTVTASGTWRHGGVPFTADGDPQQVLTGPNGPLAGAPVLALVARIGTGPAFRVRSGQAITMTATGPLSLAANDNWYALWDNAGSLAVTICVRVPAPVPCSGVEATVPGTSGVGAPVTLTAQATPRGCVGTVTYGWTFGDGTRLDPAAATTTHTYRAVGDYPWTVTARVDGTTLPGVGGLMRVTNEICVTRTVSAHPSPRPGAQYVEALWQDTGVTVQAGETLTLTASGTWRQGAVGLSADGDPRQMLTGPNGPLEGAPVLALVARIGHGPAFRVRSGQAILVPATGLLSLAANDNWYALWDNTGSLSVSICVGVPEPEPCSGVVATVPGTAAVGSPVTLAVQATPRGCVGTVTHAWTFGDGTRLDLAPATTTHTYSAAGEYSWTMTARVDGTALAVVTGTLRAANETCVNRTVYAQPQPRAGARYVEALWQDTGVAVRTGELLKVTAPGTWWHGGVALTADGDSSQMLTGPNGALEGAPMLALVARIGTGPAFLVRSGESIPVTTTGALSLAANDNWYALWDNAGSLVSAVCVGR